MILDSLGWQRVFAQLPSDVKVVQFDIDAVRGHDYKIALTLTVDGWARSVRRSGARIAQSAAFSTTEEDVVADLLRQLVDIGEMPR